MSDPQRVGVVIHGNRYSTINVTNDIKDNNNNDINVNKYALDERNFTPNTPNTQAAYDIALKYQDLSNYAFYLSVVKKLGIQEALRLDAEVQDDILRKSNTPSQVRYPKKYFAYLYKSHFKGYPNAH